MMSRDGDPGGNRRSLVLVPGFGGRPSEDFPFLLPMLERVFDVYPVDLSGIGASDGLGFLVDRIDEAVRGCGDEPALVGYSIGAVASAAYAAAHPSALAALALIAGWLEPAPKLQAFVDSWRQISMANPALLPRFAQLQLFSANGWGSASLPLIDRATERLIPLAATTDLRDLAGSIAQPTLVVGCSHDEVAATEQARLLFGAIPDARYLELDSGHGVVRERPAELLHHLVSFLSDPSVHPSGTLVPEARA